MMKKIRRITAGMTVCSMLLCGMPMFSAVPEQELAVSAADSTYGVLTYTSNGGSITITGCDRTAVSVSIPAEIDSMPVTEIAGQAFNLCESLQSVHIPEGVTTIGVQAFNGCSALQSVVLPASLESISGNAFQLCTALRSITAAEGSSTYCSVDGCLYTADGTQLVCCPGGFSGELSIPNGVSSIGAYACYSCKKLTGITMPDGITEIGNCAFELCESLTTLTLPESVTAIGKNSFSMCRAMASITLPAGITEIGRNAFLNCTALTDVYFTGTQAQWDVLAATGSSQNPLLFKAQLHLVDAQGSVSLGDLNADGAVDATDAAALLIAAANVGAGNDSGLTDVQETAADLNGDGTFDASDASLIMMYAAYTGAGGMDPIEEYLRSL